MSETAQRIYLPGAYTLQVERLAVGLQHVPYVTVAKLNAADPEARAFLAAAFSSSVTERLPSVLLYPEASTGFVRFKGKGLGRPRTGGTDSHSGFRMPTVSCCTPCTSCLSPYHTQSLRTHSRCAGAADTHGIRT